MEFRALMRITPSTMLPHKTVMRQPRSIRSSVPTVVGGAVQTFCVTARAAPCVLPRLAQAGRGACRCVSSGKISASWRADTAPPAVEEPAVLAGYLRNRAPAIASATQKPCASPASRRFRRSAALPTTLHGRLSDHTGGAPAGRLCSTSQRCQKKAAYPENLLWPGERQAHW